MRASRPLAIGLLALGRAKPKGTKGAGRRAR